MEYGSCSGKQACYKSKALVVAKSCKSGFSCKSAGYQGSVGNIANSCNELFNCYKVGLQGTVGNVKNWYNSSFKFGCGFLSSHGGTVGNIENSCNGISLTLHVCDQLGMVTGQVGKGGSIGSMTSLCKNDFTCCQVC